MRPIGLRGRVSAAFAVGALLLSALVSLVSYELIRSTLFAERERTAVRTAYFDGAVINASMAAPEALRSLDTGAERYVLLHMDGQWYSRTAEQGGGSAVPAELHVSRVDEGRSLRIRPIATNRPGGTDSVTSRSARTGARPVSNLRAC